MENIQECNKYSPLGCEALKERSGNGGEDVNGGGAGQGVSWGVSNSSSSCIRGA